jgi:hypothetical protein
MQQVLSPLYSKVLLALGYLLPQGAPTMPIVLRDEGDTAGIRSGSPCSIVIWRSLSECLAGCIHLYDRDGDCATPAISGSTASTPELKIAFHGSFEKGATALHGHRVSSATPLSFCPPLSSSSFIIQQRFYNLNNSKQDFSNAL